MVIDKIKLLFFVTLVFTINTVFGQVNTDTIFLLKEINHSVFIDFNKDSKQYKYFDDFSSDSKSSKKKKLDLPNKWVPLVQYQNEYYLYKPCDCFNRKVNLASNKISFEDCEVNFHKIKKVKKINDLNYFIIYNNHEKLLNKLEITIIDEQKGIAVFKYIKNNNEVDFQLMVDANKIKQFQVIVNDCQYSKTNEFEFEKTDFVKLLTN